jgi:osmoprotectant transport system permease protein
VIGTATLSTPIGQTSLGNYIFAGLQTQNWVLVLFGCLSAAVLALAVDQLLALIETGIRQRSRVRAALGGIGIAALVAATLSPSLAGPSSGYVVGAKTFAEQYVLSALMAQRLQAAGLTATTREGLGSNVIFRRARVSGIDVYVDYSGTLWSQPVSPHRQQAAGNARRIENDTGAAEYHARVSSVSRTPMRW